MDKRFALAVVVLVVSLGVVTYGIWTINQIPPSPYPDLGGDFVLHGTDGAVSSKDLAGKVSAIFFGYTRCPDVCPTTLIQIGGALDMLDADELARTRALFVSIDPERDTPETAGKYASHFHPAIIGLSGSSDEVAKLTQAFMVGFRKEEANAAGNYNISHSTYVFIIRPDGKVGELLGHDSKAADIAEAIRRWLPWADG